jgi:copper chaperone CopZ
MARVKQVELRALDNSIHCQGCEARIEAVLKRLPGVASVRADHRTQTVTVSLDTELTDIEEVRERLLRAGFPCQ